jgi:hypothetical protein
MTSEDLTPIFQKMFVNKIIDADGESGETEVWLDISRDTGYLSKGAL